MSAVEQYIHEWRLRMAQKGAFKSEDLDELESHLKEGIDSLSKKGLAEEEAFLISARRLGDGEGLSAEFMKINSGMIWKQRIFWMMGGYFLFTFFLAVINATQSACLLWSDWGTLPVYFFPHCRIPIIPVVLAILIVGLLYYALTKRSAPCGRLSQMTQAGKQHKTFSIVLLLFVIVIALIGGPLCQVFFARHVTPQEMGQIAMASNLSNQILKLLLSIFFVGLAVRFLSGRKQKAEA
jgi:hypothetical protein